MMQSKKEHWNNVYSNKQPHEVSWTQKIPETSLYFLNSFNLPKSASIIDVGGGDSKFAEYLIMNGYENITVLDISFAAIERAKKSLGGLADKVNWVVSDILDYKTSFTFDCWHDRATFHFLTETTEIDSYLDIARKAIKGYMIIGTFSDNGPKKCSMLNVHQYSEPELQLQLQNGFEKIKCVTEDHVTPFNTAQNFLFCSFKRAHYR